MIKITSGVSLMVALSLASGGSYASDGENPIENSLSKTLYEKGVITESEFISINSDFLEGPVSVKSKTPLIVDDGTTSFSVRSVDGSYSFHVGGQVSMDAGFHSVRNNESASEFGNGTELRRVSLDLSGRIFDNWKFKVQKRFDQAGVKGLQDAYIQYDGFKVGSTGEVLLTIGNQLPFFGWELRDSGKYIPMMERSIATQALTPGVRHLGIGLSGVNGPLWFGTGLFGAPPGRSVDLSEGDSGWSTNGRLVYTPIKDSTVLHLGSSVSYHNYGSETDLGNGNDAMLAGRSGSHLAAPLVNGRLASVSPDHAEMYNVEIAFQKHQYLFVAEYFYNKFSGLEGVANTSPEFTGYQVQGSWVLTGENHKYAHNSQRATFGPIIPNEPLTSGGKGAWELAARVSNADLNDEGINGGEVTDITLGLNWLPVKNYRVSLNYTRAIDVNGGSFDGVKYSSINARAHLWF